MADQTQATVIGESTLIPYMRKQDVAFDANNLRPRKMARIFVDDIAMNGFAQKGNKIVLNSEKNLTINAVGAIVHTPAAADWVYQGSSNLTPTFSANVKSYVSASNTLIINSMSGNFDSSAEVYVEKSNGSTALTATVYSEVNANTSDIFVMGEGVVVANTKAYMKVIGSSGENILYVNQNFINANISNITVGLTSVHFKVGDLVYQTLSGNTGFTSNTFVGKVEYFDSGSLSIAISPISGTLSTNTNAAANVCTTLLNASNTSTPKFRVTDIKLIDMTTNNLIASVTNTAANVQVVSYEHNSGAFSNVATGNLSAVFIAANANTSATSAVGNVLYITSGTGLGQFRRITAYNGRTLALASDLTVAPTSNSKYSIGNHIVDENGCLNGIINIPEEPNFKFKTGERLITITDVDYLESDDYTMKASARFASGGLRNSMQRINLTPIMRPLPEIPPSIPIIPPPPTQRLPSPAPPITPAPPRRPISLLPRRPIRDPIAQTFWTPKPDTNKVSYGVFVTSVEVFFGAKPSVARGSLQLPVQVKIAEVINGFPTQNYLAEATVKCKDVKVSTSPSVDDTDTITKFTFRDPVFLAPDTEYAIVVVSDSPEYECYVAELGGNVLGADPPQRISEQPYAGSFFRSQNSSTWTPYQNEDLMFVINKAVFTGTGSAYFNLKDAPDFDMNVDRMFINSDQLSFPVSALDFKVKGIFKSNSTFDTYTQIKPQQIFKYGDLLDASNKETSGNFLNARKLALGNANSVQLLAEFVTTDADVSPVFNMETLAVVPADHDINNAGIANTVISVTNPGAGYNAFVTSGNAILGSSNTTQNNVAQLFRETYLANNFNVAFYSITVGTDGYGSGAEGFAVANTDGSNTVNYIVMTSEGSGYLKTPTINIANGNAASGMIPASAVAQGENGKRGGNMACRYITRQIALEDGFEAGDLRVFMDAVRPNGTDIHCYYKVLGPDDPDRFSDKSWVLMNKVKDTKSKDTRQIIELQFRPDLLENELKYVENGQQYPIGGKFKYFAIKVCLTAVDTSVAPWVQNLRIIATPEG